ncbi:MAG: hypothetical protein ACXV5H_12000, partial [Halobacteriota archaeon]
MELGEPCLVETYQSSRLDVPKDKIAQKSEKLSPTPFELSAMTEDKKLPISVTALRADDYTPDGRNVIISLAIRYSTAERKYSVPVECFYDFITDLKRLNANASGFKIEPAQPRDSTTNVTRRTPTLVQAAVDGRLPRGIGVATLRDLPAEWIRHTSDSACPYKNSVFKTVRARTKIFPAGDQAPISTNPTYQRPGIENPVPIKPRQTDFSRKVSATGELEDCVVADAVTYEPVSIPKFPTNREKNREFFNFRARSRLRGPDPCNDFADLERNSLLIGTGNFCKGTGNLNARTG